MLYLILAGFVAYAILAFVEKWPPFAKPKAAVVPNIHPAPATTQDGPAIPRVPITAADAYARYMKCGGLAQARNDKFFQGGLNWYEILWLKELAPADRHAWAVAFAGNETVDPASFNTVAGIDCTANVASYLMTLTANYGISF